LGSATTQSYIKIERSKTMAIITLVLGDSGAGKSASLRNFKKGEVLVIGVTPKPLPFKNDLETVYTDSYMEIMGMLKETDHKTIVIDDSQYLMANEFMKRISEKGYDKYAEIGQHFWALIATAATLPNDKTVYFLHHTELVSNGKEKAKTIGKMLDEKITLEGLFTTVLLAECNEDGHFFRTQSKRSDTVKTPMGMFKDEKIDNDLKAVDKTIREYYANLFK